MNTTEYKQMKAVLEEIQELENIAKNNKWEGSLIDNPEAYESLEQTKKELSKLVEAYEWELFDYLEDEGLYNLLFYYFEKGDMIRINDLDRRVYLIHEDTSEYRYAYDLCTPIQLHECTVWVPEFFKLKI